MSTKMYNYRLPKDRWWEFSTDCRKFYISEHPMMKALRKMESEGAKFSQMSKWIDEMITADWTVELQLFDEGPTWLIRPLEHGYFFMNNHKRWSRFGLEPVFYDNRSDVPPEQAKNRLVAEWVDQMIDTRTYLVFYLLSKDDYMDICWSRFLAGATPPLPNA